MRRIYIFLLSAALLSLCSGCSCTHEFRNADCQSPRTCIHCGETQGDALPHAFKEADCLNPETCTHCGETRGEPLSHTFGNYEYAENQMQRSCSTCGHTEQKEMTDEERFHVLLKGHWELHTASFLTRTVTVDYLRKAFWPYFVDYDGEGTMIYTASLSEEGREKFAYTVNLSYSHFDPAVNTHYASASSPDGLLLQIQLEETDREPLLHIEGSPDKLVMNPSIFSKYSQMISGAVGMWTNILANKIIYTTLNSDWTFTANWGSGEFTGKWQPAPGSGAPSEIGGIQLYYTENKKPMMLHGGISGSVGTEEGSGQTGGLTLWLQMQNHYVRNFKNIPSEELQTMIQAGNQVILGTWDSKSQRTYAGDDTKRYIVTDYSLTVEDDGNYTLMTDRQIRGTWTLEECNGFGQYRYSFSNPGGDPFDVTLSSGELSFVYRTQSKYVTYLSFVRYDESQWASYLAGPELLPGSYVSRKVTWTDKDSGLPMEREETGYRLNILPDGTVTGTLHQNVTGTWFYNNLVEEGHSYIFRMDHTPPEQLSIRKQNGTLEFETRIDGQWFTIYFYPQ